MGRNGIYQFNRVFPPTERCISCSHKMNRHDKNQCRVSGCMCEIKNPTFDFIIKCHVPDVYMLTGKNRTGRNYGALH